VADLKNGKWRQVSCEALLVDAFALTPSLGGGNDAVGLGVGRCGSVDIGELVNRGAPRCVLLNPIEQTFPSCFEGLDMVGFLFGHGVGRDVDFNEIRGRLGSIQQQSVAGVKTVKRAADQAASKAPSAFHGRGLCLRDMMSSPGMKPSQRFNGLCPAT